MASGSCPVLAVGQVGSLLLDLVLGSGTRQVQEAVDTLQAEVVVPVEAAWGSCQVQTGRRVVVAAAAADSACFAVAGTDRRREVGVVVVRLATEEEEVEGLPVDPRMAVVVLLRWAEVVAVA